MKINIFTPPKFEKLPLNIEYLDKLTNKIWQYSVNGRSSIYHILKDLQYKKILIPVYICSTVLEPLKKLNIKPIFYDLDLEDLNPSLESIKKLSKKYNVKAVLVASMYGNPANLVEIEKYCEENDIFMIDDAAQSFGAKLDGRFVGTFGDAGFFSFSPGKPTAGHMGSFFWSAKKVNIKRTKHCLLHYLKWLDFYFNRLNIYRFGNKFRLLTYFNIVLLKIFDSTNDKICVFEKSILGGILSSNLNNKFNFRLNYINKFIDEFSQSENFKVIKHIRGIPNNHKIVVLFYNKNKAKKFIKFMLSSNIYVSNGYTLLTSDLKELPNCKMIDKCVVELPVESNEDRMKYLFKKVREFEDKNS